MAKQLLRAIGLLEHFQKPGSRKHLRNYLETGFKRGPVERVKHDPEEKGRMEAQMRNHDFIDRIEFTPGVGAFNDLYVLHPHPTGALNTAYVLRPHQQPGKMTFTSELKAILESAGYTMRTSGVEQRGKRIQRVHVIGHEKRAVGSIATQLMADGMEAVLHIDLEKPHVKPLIQLMFGQKALPKPGR